MLLDFGPQHWYTYLGRARNKLLILLSLLGKLGQSLPLRHNQAKSADFVELP
jgi:hypothetical protein